MAAPELSACRARTVPSRLVVTWLHAYAGVWGATLAAAAIVALIGGGLARLTRQLLELELSPAQTPPPQLSHVLALAAHNLPVAAWPLLLGLTGAGDHQYARRLADGLVVACLVANAAPVGAALGAYGPSVIAYIPQLPLEWAALALGYASWLTQRERPLRSQERLGLLAGILALLLAAATMETAVVPHRARTPGAAAEHGFPCTREAPPRRASRCAHAPELRSG